MANTFKKKAMWVRSELKRINKEHKDENGRGLSPAQNSQLLKELWIQANAGLND